MDPIRNLRRSRSANLLKMPFKPGDAEYDRLFALSRVRENDDCVHLDVPTWAPTIALDEEVRKTFALTIPTTGGFFSGQGCPGLYSVAAGMFIWTPDGELLVLERDKDAPIYPGHLTEPAGRLSAMPEATITREVNEELLLMVRDGPHERALILVHGYDASLCSELVDRKRHQIARRSHAVRAAGYDPARLAEADPYILPAAPQFNDLPRHRRVAVTVAGRPEADFSALVWVQHDRRSIEIRRSTVLTLPPGAHDLTALDGEAFDRPVRRLGDRGLSESMAPPIPSLAAYRQMRMRPRLSVVAGG